MWSATHRKLRNGERDPETKKYSRLKSQIPPENVKKANLPIYRSLQERHDIRYLKEYRKKLNLLQVKYSEVDLSKHRPIATFNDKKVDLKGNLNHLPKKVQRLDTKAAMRIEKEANRNFRRVQEIIKTDVTDMTFKSNKSNFSGRSLSQIYRGPSTKKEVAEKMDSIRKGLETTLIKPNPLIQYDLPDMVKK